MKISLRSEKRIGRACPFFEMSFVSSRPNFRLELPGGPVKRKATGVVSRHLLDYNRA